MRLLRTGKGPPESGSTGHTNLFVRACWGESTAGLKPRQTDEGGTVMANVHRVYSLDPDFSVLLSWATVGGAHARQAGAVAARERLPVLELA